MALKRTTKSLPEDDDDIMEEEESTEEEEDGEEEEEREFPRWLRPLLIAIGMLLALGAGAAFGGIFVRNHDKKNEVVATINGEEITIQSLNHRMDVAAGNNAAHTMAQEMLFLQYAKKEDTLPKESEVASKYSEISADPKFSAELFRTHQAAEDIKRSLRINMARSAFITRGISVNEAETRQFYQSNINRANPNAQFFRPETVLIGIIVTQSAEEINKAVAALKEGQPFATVAKLYSKDRSATNGGMMPAIRRGQPGLEKSPEMNKIIFTLKPQQQTNPVRIGDAFWIIRCFDRQSEMTVPFEKAKSAAERGMLLYKGQLLNGKKIQDGLDAFQATSQINVRWPQYADAVTAKTSGDK